MHINIIHNTEIDNWIAGRHYLHSTPAGSVLRMEILDDNNNRIGAMLWGRPTARQIDQRHVLQLTRMFMVDDTEHCAESRALAMARKYIRRHMPQIKGLISYSSEEEGHKGTIYQADGWFAISRTKSVHKGWSNRQGRSDRDLGPKTKWGRTP